MTATEILAILSPEDLFTEDDVDKKYKMLAKKWHPDVSKDPRSNDVFAHLSSLYSEALKKIHNGAWGCRGVLKLKDKLRVQYIIRYQYEEPFELGTMYVSDKSLIYILEEKYEKLFNNGIFNFKGMKFPNKGADLLKKCFPEIKKTFTTDDNRHVLVLHKTPDTLPLKVALNYFGGSFEPKTAAWIISCLHNTLCALKFNKYAHNDISTSTYFISPQHHTGLLLGGWWYSALRGSKLIGVPQRSYSVMSLSQKQDKKATSALDSELLRLTAREILGDSSGFKLESMGIPKVIERHLNIPSNKDAYSDYEQWGEVLTKAFGPRKFIPMDVNIKKAYEMMPRRS